MFTSKQDAEILLLQHEIELKESTYKYAVELRIDSGVLIRMRDHVKTLKERLENIQARMTIKY